MYKFLLGPGTSYPEVKVWYTLSAFQIVPLIHLSVSQADPFCLCLHRGSKKLIYLLVFYRQNYHLFLQKSKCKISKLEMLLCIFHPVAKGYCYTWKYTDTIISKWTWKFIQEILPGLCRILKYLFKQSYRKILQIY